ncbi:hypothetical protein O9993_00790 [Vibrio lentus]|nr:hypothetical protein [Vibrio lentus]
MNSWIEESGTLLRTQVTTFQKAQFLNTPNNRSGLAASSNNELDGQADVDASYINIAAMYHLDNADMGIDIKQDSDGYRIGETSAQYDEENTRIRSSYYYF